jgi:hypothetical protein
MLGFTAALGAELATGQSVFTQFNEAAAPIIATAVIFTIASLVPITKGSNKEAFGPFTPQVSIKAKAGEQIRQVVKLAHLRCRLLTVVCLCDCRRRPPMAALQ